MAGSSEATGEKDEPPAADSSKTDANVNTKSAPVATQTPEGDSKGDELEHDDFGLPVRQKPRTLDTDQESNSEDDETPAYGTPGETRSRDVSPSPPQRDAQHEANAPEHHVPESKAENGAIKLPPTPAQLAEEESKGGQPPPSDVDPPPAYHLTDAADRPRDPTHHTTASAAAPTTIVNEPLHARHQSGPFSEHSHQVLAPPKRVDPEDDNDEGEEGWKTMPAFAPYDLYDDDNRLVAREEHDSDNEANAYSGLGGAGKGYTRVQVDEDAKSATSMDDNTDYLFKGKVKGGKGVDEEGRGEVEGGEGEEEEQEQRDPVAQLETTKTLLSETQKIAYVGVTRLAMAKMVKELDDMESTKSTKKGKAVAVESMKMWSQKMMVRLYAHMEISSSEQVMIEQLAEHGVETADMTPALMQSARIKNPMAEEKGADKGSKASPEEGDKEDAKDGASPNSPKLGSQSAFLKSPKDVDAKGTFPSSQEKGSVDGDAEDDPSPEYKEHDEKRESGNMSPSQLGTDKDIDIDLRWTVLCDLFLVLLIDSVYDSRSRVLLERVGEALEVPWLEISRFEKRVTDSLEMQETANKETWDEAEHLENRRKRALKRRYMMMGLATVGGSLVIGLSAGVLAPVIGAGLAAGFTTIGVTGTSAFLTGAGASALITTGAVGVGGSIGIKASNRRTGAVKTFEYRPLHNNKRVNLIVTVSGWMSSKVDDVRLPFSTLDPVMGDMYSVLWEPEMLTSMGDTINILATEALTQTIQQVLGSTILITLMAAIQLPIVLSKLSYLIDNPWTVSMGRANAAGLILADSLIDRNLGVRPITFVGFSLGARVIFACLRELSNRGAYGIVQNVFLFGSPIVANKDEYLRARAVVSGRFVNGYATNDWILGYLFRATGGGIMRVAGLAKVEVSGIENIDVTEFVNGHMAYRAAMPKILRRVGWEVESDEFAEIEDPDPENHAARQRELIKEIDEARRVAEEKPEKKRFGFFKMGKLAEKKKWETYDDNKTRGGNSGEDDFGTSAVDTQGNVLFDIEAIKRELASEHIEVKQLESTLPPIKLGVNDFKAPEGTQRSQPSSPYSNLRETKSYDGMKSPTTTTKPSPTSSSKPTTNPFNKGYDDYNLSSETMPISPPPSIAPGIASADHGKLSFEELQMSSPIPSPGLSPGRQHVPGSPLRKEMESQRPVLARSAVSTPAPLSPREQPPVMEGGHNAWADADADADADVDDEDFGKEREISMTFG